MVKISANL